MAVPAKRKAAKPNGRRPSLGLPDELAAAQEACRLAQEGNLKLSRSVDLLRGQLELIVQAEFDHKSKRLVTASDLRQLAVEGLDAYSEVSGQDWRRRPLIGNRAGTTGNPPVHESQMQENPSE